MCKRHRGPNHPITFVAMNNVAWLYQEDKRLDKAVALYEEALAGMRKKLPPLHPERLNTTASLARAYYLAEEIDKAVPLQESVLPQYRTAYGVNEARTLYVFNLLIGYDVDAGWCDKAEALLNSTQNGGANRRTTANLGQDQREKRYRELIQRVRPAADKYRQEHVDVILAIGAAALRFSTENLRGVLPGVPIVFALTNDTQRASGTFQSSTLSKGRNQCSSSLAREPQKPSGSAWASSHIAW